MTDLERLARDVAARLSGDDLALVMGYAALNEELSILVSEALDLCVRARKLDSFLDERPGDDPLLPRSGTPALWVQEQYENDLATWEMKARAVIGVLGENRQS